MNTSTVIKPNQSFKEAINETFKSLNLDPSVSYQFLNEEPFFLRKNGKTTKIVMNKIRVALVKNKWAIVEFNVIPEGAASPVRFCGEYELLSEIKCHIYG